MGTRIATWAGPMIGFVAAFLVVRVLIPEHSDPNQLVMAGVEEAAVVEANETDLVVPEQGSAATATGSALTPAPSVPAASDAPPVAKESAEAKSVADGVLLHGTVTNPMGEPLEQAFLSVDMPTGDRVAARSDSLGRYALGPLPVGRWTVATYVRNHHNERVDVDLPGARQMERLDLVLRPQQVVRVRIATSAGEPSIPALYGAGHEPYRLALVPVATAEDPGTTFTEVSGSLNNPFGIGSFGQPGFIGPNEKYPDEYGAVTLMQDGPAWISLVAAHQVLAKQRVQPGDEVVSFTLDPEDVDALCATIRATVLDGATGKPLQASAFLGVDPMFNGEDKTDTDAATGALVMEGALPGRKWLMINLEGRAPIRRQIDVPRGETLELGELVMNEPVSIAGTVTRADGTPLEAIVHWGVLDEPSGKVEWAAQTRTQSGPDGGFTIRTLEPALYVVWSPGLPARSPRPHDASQASLAARVDARTESVDDVQLQLLPTSRVTLSTGELEAPYATARAFDASGLPARSTWLGRWGPEAHLDLIEGVYTLEVTRAGEELLRRTLKVEGAPQRIELEIKPR